MRGHHVFSEFSSEELEELVVAVRGPDFLGDSFDQ